MIETHKAWSTEYILGLPICRMRQVLELITQDLHERAKFQTQVVEWATKNICSMFITQAESQKQAKQIQRLVEKMKLPLAGEEADLVDERSFEEIVEEGAKVDLSSQPSFEALEAAFANGI